MTFSHAEGSNCNRNAILKRVHILIREFLPRFCNTIGGRRSSPGPRLGPNVESATSIASTVRKSALGSVILILFSFAFFIFWLLFLTEGSSSDTFLLFGK